MNFGIQIGIWRLLSLMAGAAVTGVLGGLFLGWLAWGHG